MARNRRAVLTGLGGLVAGGLGVHRGGTTATSDTATTTATTTTSEPQTGVIVESSELKAIDNPFVDSLWDVPAVDATIINKDNVSTGKIKATVHWLDSNGRSLNSSTEYLDFLSGGETWRARITPLFASVKAQNVEDYELFVPSPSSPLWTLNPDGITVVSELARVSAMHTYVSGELKNERTSTVEYLRAIGKVYDSKGRVMTSALASKETLPPGETWRMDTRARTHGRADQVEEGRITPMV